VIMLLNTVLTIRKSVAEGSLRAARAATATA
jgi:hypothetical protein